MAFSDKWKVRVDAETAARIAAALNELAARGICDRGSLALRDGERVAAALELAAAVLREPIRPVIFGAALDAGAADLAQRIAVAEDWRRTRETHFPTWRWDEPVPPAACALDRIPAAMSRLRSIFGRRERQPVGTA